MLLDIVLYDNGFVKVLDLGELASAREQRLISEETALLALHTADRLLGLIYDEHFSNYRLPIIKAEAAGAGQNPSPSAVRSDKSAEAGTCRPS